MRGKKAYSKIGGYSLPPHVGGFSGVAHHLHGVHLNTEISVNELADMQTETEALLQRQQIETRCNLFAA